MGPLFLALAFGGETHRVHISQQQTPTRLSVGPWWHPTGILGCPESWPVPAVLVSFTLIMKLWNILLVESPFAYVFFQAGLSALQSLPDP